MPQPDSIDYVDIPPGAIKIDLPNTAQLEDYTCGPAALLAIFTYYGVGPEQEDELAQVMGISTEGSDPVHLVTAARRFGLTCEEFRPMTIAQLERCLDARRPVLIMLQAWGSEPSPYRVRWDDGHWIVAIGYAGGRVYFEDPLIYSTRGYLTYEELDLRWHDLEGADNVRVEHYGVAIWKPDVTESVFAGRARRIE